MSTIGAIKKRRERCNLHLTINHLAVFAPSPPNIQLMKDAGIYEGIRDEREREREKRRERERGKERREEREREREREKEGERESKEGRER